MTGGNIMQSTSDKRSVLIVDDDIDFVIQLKYQFENEGYEIISAEGQYEAEEILTDFLPDCAVVDLMLENVDGGITLASHIKRKDPTIPVVIVTSVSRDIGMKFEARTEEELSWMKADLILNKPVRFEQLLREINRLLKESSHDGNTNTDSVG